jgi:acyl transferase domain-containing protein
MMQEAYNSMPDIRQMLDHGNRIFFEMRGYSLLDIMFGNDPALNRTENTQPAIFLSTAAIFNHFNQLGFTPDYFIGHSVGEYSALYCSGMLAFDDAMQLVVKRADFMKAAIEVHPGAIMVVFKDPDESHALIRESGIADLWVANKNSEGQTAVSGTQTAIDRFCDWFKSRNHMFKKLPLSGAFHTPLFANAAEKMAAYLEPIVFNNVDFGQVISNVTAQPYPANADGVKALLTRQIISPVEFIASVKTAHAAGFRQFYEIGLGRILGNLLKNISVDGIDVQAAIHPKSGEVASLDNLRREMHSKGLIQAQTGQVDEPLADLPATANHAKALSKPIPFKASEETTRN